MPAEARWDSRRSAHQKIRLVGLKTILRHRKPTSGMKEWKAMTVSKSQAFWENKWNPAKIISSMPDSSERYKTEYFKNPGVRCLWRGKKP